MSSEAAEGANDPACAEVMVLLPDALGDQERRWTDAQSTAAWGNPVTVSFSCGLDAVAASELACEDAGGVDWLIDDSQAPIYRFISFGREPAVQVILNYEVVSSRTALDAIGRAADQLPTTGAECTPMPNM